MARSKLGWEAGRLALAVASLLGVSCALGEPPPRAVHGVLDLRAWEPGDGTTVRLDGDWRFFPRRLLAPGDPELAGEAPGYHAVPGTWGTAVGAAGEPSGHGFATYALTVLLPPSDAQLALGLISASTAFRLFADGVPVAEAGAVSTSADGARPQYRPRVVGLAPVSDGALDLVLQVSNFHYAKGGAWEPIWIGTRRAVAEARESRVALALFLAGSFAVIGLYHLMLWAARRADRSPLWFAAVCFGMAVRGLTVDEIYLVDLLPRLSWANLTRLEYGSLLVIVAAAAPFLRGLFPADQPLALTRAYGFAALGGLGLVAVLPPAWFSRGLPAVQLLCVTAALVGSVLLARSLARGREGAALFLVGVVAIALTGIHDTLVSIFRALPTGEWLVSSIYLQPFGLFVFILCQAMLLAQRSSRAFGELEQTSRELRAAHVELDARTRDLESRVVERTADLERANRLLARLAEIDGLTRVGNRRFFDEELRRAWHDHARRAAELSLILVDVDHFKAYNDQYGHLAGDETLRQVAAAAARSAQRPGDVVARWGGEELAALLPNTGLDGALHVAEQLRARVEATAIPHRASASAACVTVSVGVAAITPRAGGEASQLVDLADRALYRAKQEGRNRVVAD